jgi:glycosyltransferase involved in cell wall biosynthesis
MGEPAPLDKQPERATFAHMATENSIATATSLKGVSNGVKLLITTQAVDLDDPVLGFFHRWIEEFAKQYESIEVICLQEGRHTLPANVHVHSLGKENEVSRAAYVFRFYAYIWNLRNRYDSVFVHMNQEYVLLGWKFWWLFRKRIVLWRNHKKGSVLTRFAALVSRVVCYTSPAAYVAGYGNAVRMPIGIDTGVFKPSGSADPHSLLFLGRLDAVKRPETLLKALDILAGEGVIFNADIVGDPTRGREAFMRELKQRFSAVPNVSFKPAIRNDEAVTAYTSHALYVNLTSSGSFDKTIGEAMASGCIVVAANDVLRGVIPDELLVDADSPESVARGIEAALALGEEGRKALSARLREYIVREHSLPLLVQKLENIFRR